MFIDEPRFQGRPPIGTAFYIGKMTALDEEADPDLLFQIGWKAGQYDFDFYEADVLTADDIPTSSWIEIAFCQQLGGAFVLWRSGVPGLDTPRSISYGWVESADIDLVGQSVEAKAAARGPALTGYLFNIKKYYESCRNDDRPSHPH